MSETTDLLLKEFFIEPNLPLKIFADTADQKSKDEINEFEDDSIIDMCMQYESSGEGEGIAFPVEHILSISSSKDEMASENAFHSIVTKRSAEKRKYEDSNVSYSANVKKNKKSDPPIKEEEASFIKEKEESISTPIRRKNVVPKEKSNASKRKLNTELNPDSQKEDSKRNKALKSKDIITLENKLIPDINSCSHELRSQYKQCYVRLYKDEINNYISNLNSVKDSGSKVLLPSGNVAKNPGKKLNPKQKLPAVLKNRKQRSEFQVEDLVWAKMKGYPPWPAKIVDMPENTKPSKKKNAHYVFFFGTKNFAFIPQQNIYKHSDTLLKHVENYKSTDMQDGVQTYLSLYYSQKEQKHVTNFNQLCIKKETLDEPMEEVAHIAQKNKKRKEMDEQENERTRADSKSVLNTENTIDNLAFSHMDNATVTSHLNPGSNPIPHNCHVSKNSGDDPAQQSDN